jgi:SAM-dependent methyltransferase
VSRPELDWGDGEYEHTAVALAPVAEVLLDTLAVAPGDRLLDVGCGTGNVALAAAGRGARVTGVDPSAGLLDRARERTGADAVTWAVMRDGELPVDDGAFDVVASCFAVIFAPDAAQAAAGLRRAAVPGGRIGLTAWVPEGVIGDVGRIVMAAMAPGAAPAAWADPDVAAGLLGCAVSVTHHEVAFTSASPEAWLDDQVRHHPVWRLAVRALPAETWADARERSLEVLTAGNEDPAAFQATSPYVVVAAMA